MPEEKQTSLRPRWVPLWLWQWRWVALAVLFILAWWLVPPLLYRHTGADAAARLKAITDTRTALVAGLIGVGALLTFWLNSRVYQITARTLQVTEQGHITERYTKAIEPLGDDGLTIRLVGIYALERIAVDSERDHPTFVEVLSAFVRESAAAPPPDDGPEQKPKPATDVQAALTVLGRLPKRANVSRGDLSGAQLAGTDLAGAHLNGADLTGPAHRGEPGRRPAQRGGPGRRLAQQDGPDRRPAQRGGPGRRPARRGEPGWRGARRGGLGRCGPQRGEPGRRPARRGGPDPRPASWGGPDPSPARRGEPDRDIRPHAGPARRHPWRCGDAAPGRTPAAGRLAGRRGLGSSRLIAGGPGVVGLVVGQLAGAAGGGDRKRRASSRARGAPRRQAPGASGARPSKPVPHGPGDLVSQAIVPVHVPPSRRSARRRWWSLG
jgi:hypothetical protein